MGREATNSIIPVRGYCGGFKMLCRGENKFGIELINDMMYLAAALLVLLQSPMHVKGRTGT